MRRNKEDANDQEYFRSCRSGRVRAALPARHVMTVLIAGAGIAGLAMALTCHEIGVPFRVYEAREKVEPLGVGINLQPVAVRELIDMGLGEQLDEIGVRTREYGLYSKHGLTIWTEPRGLAAGYNWPQYSVHRGQLLMLLYREVLRRAGPDRIACGWRATGFENSPKGAILALVNSGGTKRVEEGSVLIAADGLHSAIRRQIAPQEGPPVWGGTIMWRGITEAACFKSGATMAMIGHDGLRFVTYPISAPDPASGKALINWIATLKFDATHAWRKEDWNRKARLADFLPRFEGMIFDWLDVPGLIRAAGQVYEYPMVDRDPLERWTEGAVTLMGDAAHPAYPVGSNGAGSAILDARRIGQSFLDHGVCPAALEAYESGMRPMASQVVLTNRVAGPDSILDVVEARCGGQFDRIEDVIPHQEMADHAARYKAVAGLGVESTNGAPRTIPDGARVRTD
jgi:2-polyprenyl-6-methoxyphenol hydroxylase-like FAD-dependent oxidoreductase